MIRALIGYYRANLTHTLVFAAYTFARWFLRKYLKPDQMIMVPEDESPRRGVKNYYTIRSTDGKPLGIQTVLRGEGEEEGAPSHWLASVYLRVVNAEGHTHFAAQNAGKALYARLTR